MIDKYLLSQGLALLRQPLLPLASMVQFIYLTGAFPTVEEVIDQLPGEIETGFALYRRPADLLLPHADLFRPLEQVKAGQGMTVAVVDGAGKLLDGLGAASALVFQGLLARELERINSLLCAPCGCTLCCVGPDDSMRQHYFEIPLAEDEVERFDLTRIDSPASRAGRAEDEEALPVDGRPFYEAGRPLMIRWQPGWSLILPRQERCPQLEDPGRCRIYADRPRVCRRPQIFPYVLEELESVQYRRRDSVLAVLDCPYVQALREEIAAFAAASELEMVFRQNKG